MATLYYTTIEDLQDRLGESLYNKLTNREGGETGDDDIAAQMLEEAEAVVHSWIGGRYAVPVDVSSDTVLALTLKRRVLQIAPFVAHANAIRRSIPENWRDLYDEAMKWLRAVGKGDIPLSAETRPTTSTDGETTSSFVGPSPVFKPDNLENF